MLVFALPELLAVGKYLLHSRNVPGDLRGQYSWERTPTGFASSVVFFDMCYQCLLST